MTCWDDAWSHLKWLYERTDRFYTIAAAAWYEANQPWFLAGIRLKVEEAIDRREANA